MVIKANADIASQLKVKTGEQVYHAILKLSAPIIIRQLAVKVSDLRCYFSSLKIGMAFP